ncbi:MAG: hypothetical protein AAB573_01385 [Patescibacteria group bacterium]
MSERRTGVKTKIYMSPSERRVSELTDRAVTRERERFLNILKKTHSDVLVEGDRFGQIVMTAVYVSGLSIRNFAKKMKVVPGAVYCWQRGDVGHRVRHEVINDIRKLFLSIEAQSRPVVTRERVYGI